MNSVITLLKTSPELQRREVFCTIKSVGYREFYAASGTDFHPETKFILADYLEYQGEKLLLHNGTLYRIIRTYRTGLRLELTAEQAPAEDGEGIV